MTKHKITTGIVECFVCNTQPATHRICIEGWIYLCICESCGSMEEAELLEAYDPGLKGLGENLDVYA